MTFLKHLLLCAFGACAGPAAAATVHIDLQPVGICTEAGCADTTFNKGYLKRIWRQADLRITVLPAMLSAPLKIATDGAGDLVADDTLRRFTRWQREEGIETATAYIGLAQSFAGSTIGLAYRNSPDYPLYPYATTEAFGGRYGTAIIAHELGHILGLGHDSGQSLMSPVLRWSDYQDRDFLPWIDPAVGPLVEASRLAARRADIAVVPVPPAGAALLSVVLCLALWASAAQGRCVPVRPHTG